MLLSRPRARLGLKLATALVLAFLYVPLIVILVLSFSSSKSFTWPPPSFTPDLVATRRSASRARATRCGTSVKVALAATGIALVLGSLASYAVQRFRFFGRNTVSLLLVLPIALPGIVTGVALNSAFQQAGVALGFFTLIVAHATFCIVVVFNNVIARLRRLAPNVDEASADLGADLFQTFRYVTFPLVRSALRGRRAAGLRPLVRRDRRHDLHGRRGHRDVAPVDLQQHVPARTSCRPSTWSRRW